MIHISQNARATLVSLVQGIEATPEGLVHPRLGQMGIQVSSRGTPALVSLTYGAVDWDERTQDLLQNTSTLVKLNCGLNAWQAATEDGLPAQLHLIQRTVEERLSAPRVAFLQAYLQLGLLRLWSFSESLSGMAQINEAEIDARGGLYMSHDREVIQDIASGQTLTRAQLRDRAPMEALSLTTRPLSAVPFKAFSFMASDQDGEHYIKDDLYPDNISGHARMAIFQGILDGYRGVGLPDPDLTGLRVVLAAD